MKGLVFQEGLRRGAKVCGGELFFYLVGVCFILGGFGWGCLLEGWICQLRGLDGWWVVGRFQGRLEMV